MDKEPDIVTVTLNPAIDRTVFVGDFHPGAVNRASGQRLQAGGKGVNVSALLGHYGIPSIATGFMGKENDGLFVSLFRKAGVTDRFLRLPGETRTGIKIIDGSKKETTDINFPGLRPEPAELASLGEQLRNLAKAGRWFVLAGSVPEGIGLNWFREAVAMLKRQGAKVAVDTSGEALRVAIGEGVDLIKPNEYELADYLGEPQEDFTSLTKAAMEIRKEKVEHVILSFGEKGALFLSPGSAIMASAPPVAVVSTVGAGDSLLAGYLAGLVSGADPERRASLATTFAWSTLENPSRELPDRPVLERMMTEVEMNDVSYGET